MELMKVRSMEEGGDCCGKMCASVSSKKEKVKLTVRRALDLDAFINHPVKATPNVVLIK